MRVGILGGSFDPIHNGHLHMALSAQQTYNLDEVWLIPAGHSPNKDESKMTSAVHRLNMCKIAVEEFPTLIASDYEIQRKERSYTYRTLVRLKEEYPTHDFFFIMGADSLDYFDEWVHPEIITSLCTILVIIRDLFSLQDMERKINELKSKFSCSIEIVPCEQYDISSTQLRNELKEHKYNCSALPAKVIEYIKQNGLYTYE